MPKAEIAQNLLPGQEATVFGPGTLKFEAINAIPEQAVTAKATGGAVTLGKGAAAGKGMGMTMATGGGGAAAKSLPASLLSGKVLGVSLGSMNPWILLAIGGIGGYMYAKRKFPRLVW